MVSCAFLSATYTHVVCHPLFSFQVNFKYNSTVDMGPTAYTPAQARILAQPMFVAMHMHISPGVPGSGFEGSGFRIRGVLRCGGSPMVRWSQWGPIGVAAFVLTATPSTHQGGGPSTLCSIPIYSHMTLFLLHPPGGNRVFRWLGAHGDLCHHMLLRTIHSQSLKVVHAWWACHGYP